MRRSVNGRTSLASLHSVTACGLALRDSLLFGWGKMAFVVLLHDDPLGMSGLSPSELLLAFDEQVVDFRVRITPTYPLPTL
jgi:hypothetical protein